jgi:beta-galactosidase
VSGTRDPQLFKNYRHGRFTYRIPLADGAYSVTLAFIEPDKSTAVGNRVFDVLANGSKKIENLDVLKEAGAYRKVVTRSFAVSVSGGQLELDFRPVRGEAVVSTISIRSRNVATAR